MEELQISEGRGNLWQTCIYGLAIGKWQWMIVP